ncbi:DUF3089 domain-containing protein [Sphingomonas sp.]|uniref:DUF3089 domain-containing protein n=1 Tax=Sphingomonas sp. TaxID=28214 RepID=UPI002D80A7CF|nr:DUF3089 domain-containing protein [Sphingomonas sp.]HEU0043648.1 DUF3089 domain-containing protein [Sphingomonas sp.]
MARKFLYVVAALIVLAIAAAFTYRFYGTELLRYWLVPKAQFVAQPSLKRSVYDDPQMWFARPGVADDPSRSLPASVQPAASSRAAVFFIHPTSYVGGDQWNAALADEETNWRARVFLRGQASAFAAAGQVWAPRYRQANFGAFLTTAPEAQKSLDLAYGDVATAFDAFLAQVEPGRPLILAGHSQGALHLSRLLRERVAGTKLARRIVAAYVVGWPISVTTDLPRLGLPACASADQSGCILSWASFAEPADPGMIVDAYDATTGFTGAPRRGTPILCTNPLTGGATPAAPATANLGTLVPTEDLSSATMVVGSVPARCDERGFLLIGEPPQVGNYVLPGNNYHVYDYSLFWANVRADALKRLAAWR